MTRRLEVHGHRGARGLAPENTLASMAAAFDAGVDGIEIDVQLSADGHVVVWHDPVVDPLKCIGDADLMGARVWDTPLDRLRCLDVGSLAQQGFPRQRLAPGERIVTLAELLDAYAEQSARGTWWTIELKLDPTDPGQAARRDELVTATLERVRVAGVQRQCWIHSFDWACLETSRRLAPDVPTSALAAPRANWHEGSAWLGSIDPAAYEGDLSGAVAALGASVVAPHHSMVDRDLVTRAHALGLKVLAWTVNDRETAARLADLGVDVLCTDVPDELAD